MRLFYTVLYFLFIAYSVCIGQTNFQYTITPALQNNGMSIGNAVVQTLDSGFVIVGSKEDFSIMEIQTFQAKINKSGTLQWSNAFSTGYYNGSLCVDRCADGGTISTGFVHSHGGNPPDQLSILKTDSFGSIQWSSILQGIYMETCNSIKENKDGSFVLSTTTSSAGIGLSDIGIIKLNNSGTFLFQKAYGGPAEDVGNYITETNDSGFIVCGSTMSFSGHNMYLLKLNTQGDTLWTKEIIGTGITEGMMVQQTSDSGFVVVGYPKLNGGNNPVSYIVKTNSSGDAIWAKKFSSPPGIMFTSIRLAADNGFDIGGALGINSENTFLLHLNSSGDTLWTRKYDFGKSQVPGNTFQKTFDNNYIIAGYGGAGQSLGAFIAKTDSTGRLECNQSFLTLNIDTVNAVSLSCATTNLNYSLTTTLQSFFKISSDSILFDVCGLSSTGPIQVPNNLSIFPNPAMDQFIISNLKGDSQIEIFNLLGENIYSASANRELCFVKCISFPTGIYFVIVTNASNEKATRKVAIYH
ncbi:MAG: T9SS type A sorting domain-containing protein [Bacteroidota bacterium]